MHLSRNEFVHNVPRVCSIVCSKKTCFYKNQFLGFGQSNIDSKFQDFWEKSVTSGAFTSWKPSILDHFWAEKVFGDSKNDFFQKSKNPFLGFGQSNIDSKFQDFRVKSVALGAFTSSKPFILDHFRAEKVFGASKNDFFQKSKNPFLGFCQINIVLHYYFMPLFFGK